MIDKEIEFRELKRTAYCRGCDKEMKPATKVIATYSWRNRGQHIYFCTDCVEKMSALIKNNKHN